MTSAGQVDGSDGPETSKGAKDVPKARAGRTVEPKALQRNEMTIEVHGGSAFPLPGLTGREPAGSCR